MPGVPFFGKGTIVVNIGILETPSPVPLHLLSIHLLVRYFSYIKIFLYLTVNVLLVSPLPLKVVGQEKVSLLGDVLAYILSLEGTANFILSAKDRAQDKIGILTELLRPLKVESIFARYSPVTMKIYNSDLKIMKCLLSVKSTYHHRQRYQ